MKLFNSLVTLLFLLVFSTSYSQLYFSVQEEGNIYYQNLSNGEIDTVVVTESMIRRVRVDESTEKIYWSAKNESISRSNFDGSNKEEIEIEGVTSTSVIEVIDSGRSILFTEDGVNKIYKYNLETELLTIEVDDATGVNGIAVDELNGDLYWTEYFTGNIYKYTSGEVSPVLIASTASLLMDIQYDYVHDVLYFSERSNNTIIKMNVDGSSQMSIGQFSNNIGAISLDPLGHQVYVVETADKSVTSMNLNGSLKSTIDFNGSGLIGGGDIIQTRICNGIYYDTVNVYDTTVVYIEKEVSRADTLVIDLFILGVENKLFGDKIEIYPNPTNDFIVVKNTFFNDMSSYSVLITNLQLQSVYQSDFEANEMKVEISSLGNDNVYLLHILGPQGDVLETRKVLLNK